MSAASRIFDEGLRAIVRDPLKSHGFAFDGSRTFRRPLEGSPAVQIINFQLGQRSLQGKFAVNLGVFVPGELKVYDPGFRPERPTEYHCAMERRERLGRTIPGRIPSLAEVPWLGFFFGPRDVWWKFSEDPVRTQRSLETALGILEKHGFAWLDAHSPGND